MSRLTVFHILAVTTIAATVFFTNLGQARFWDRDEPRNAGCAYEMMQRGDLVVPIFNDELRHHKPVLTYWLMISAYHVFGFTEFAARFWSALLGVGTVLLTYAIARRLFGSKIALLSGIVLSTSLMFCVEARAATPDSALIFFSTLGIFFYITGTFAPHDDERAKSLLRNPGQWFPQNMSFVISMNSAFALAVLTKGPIGILVPSAIIGMFLLIQRLTPLENSNAISSNQFFRRLYSIIRLANPIHFLSTLWYMRPLTAGAIVLLIAAPWYIAVGIETHGDFNRLFFLHENFARATTVMENHGGSWFYYPATIAIGFFPWSVFLVPISLSVIHSISRSTSDRSPITFLTCWVLVQIGLFTIAETKLPSYVTPCYPALAILVAFCILKWLPSLATTAEMKWHLATMGTYILAGLATSVGLGIATAQFFPEIWWIAGLGLIPIIGGSLAIYLHRSRRPLPGIIATTASAFLFSFCMFAVGTVVVDSTRQTHLVLDEIKLAAGDQAVASYQCHESSWVVYANKPIFELNRSPITTGVPATLNRDYYWKKKPVIRPEDFVALQPNAQIITTDEHASELLARLPDDFQIAKQTDFFLKKDRDLVLIQRRNQIAENNSTAKKAAIQTRR